MLSRRTLALHRGAVISPLLANIYLHYVFDLWADHWRHNIAKGNVIFVRYADDLIAGFQYESDARRFLEDMKKRLEKFELSLHPEKTRLIEFGRDAADNRSRRGEGKPDTFTFLGFTHICGKARNGNFLLMRTTRRDRMNAKLKEIKEELWMRMHDPIPEQGKWLRQVVIGYLAYNAIPTNSRRIGAFWHRVICIWRNTLRRRSQKDHFTWDRIKKLAEAWLPRPRILHPWPNIRFDVKHPRWEPGARIALAGICTGGAP